MCGDDVFKQQVRRASSYLHFGVVSLLQCLEVLLLGSKGTHFIRVKDPKSVTISEHPNLLFRPHLPCRHGLIDEVIQAVINDFEVCTELALPGHNHTA